MDPMGVLEEVFEFIGLDMLDPEGKKVGVTIGYISFWLGGPLRYHIHCIFLAHVPNGADFIPFFRVQNSGNRD